MSRQFLQSSYPQIKILQIVACFCPTGRIFAARIEIDGEKRLPVRTPMKGTRSSPREPLIYNPYEGTYSGRRFVVWSGYDGLQGELTIHGSGRLLQGLSVPQYLSGSFRLTSTGSFSAMFIPFNHRDTEAQRHSLDIGFYPAII